jgi:integrase
MAASAHPMTIPSAEVLAGALRYLRDHDEPSFYAAARLGASAGRRRSEIFGLRWLDLSDGALTVAQVVVVVLTGRW